MFPLSIAFPILGETGDLQQLKGKVGNPLHTFLIQYLSGSLQEDFQISVSGKGSGERGSVDQPESASSAGLGG